MMRSAYLTLAATFVLFGAGVVVAQDHGKAKSLTAMGAVKSVTGGSFVVDTEKGAMTFGVDAKTNVQAKGATSKTRAKKEAGEGGLTIADVVHVGDQVLVRYTEAGGTFVASEIEVRQRRPAAAQPIK
jgi:hypothetical protein